MRRTAGSQKGVCRLHPDFENPRLSFVLQSHIWIAEACIKYIWASVSICTTPAGIKRILAGGAPRLFAEHVGSACLWRLKWARNKTASQVAHTTPASSITKCPTNPSLRCVPDLNHSKSGDVKERQTTLNRNLLFSVTRFPVSNPPGIPEAATWLTTKEVPKSLLFSRSSAVFAGITWEKNSTNVLTAEVTCASRGKKMDPGAFG